MFFHLQLLRHPNSPFTIPWTVATLGIKHVPKKTILEVNIVKLCEALEKYFISQSTLAQERLSLKLSSILLDGTTLILKEQATILFIDIQNAFLQTFRTQSSLVVLPYSMANETLFTPPVVIQKKRKANKKPRQQSSNDVQIFRPLFEFEQININESEQVQPDVILQSRVDEITLREHQNAAPTMDMILDDFGDFGQLNLEDELLPTLDKNLVSGKPPAKRAKISKGRAPVEKLKQQAIDEEIILMPLDHQEVNLPVVQADVTAVDEQRQPMDQDLPLIQPQPQEVITPLKRKVKPTQKANQNETNNSLHKMQNKMFLKIRPIKKLVTEKPALKALPLVGLDLLEKRTPFICFEVDIKPYLDRYLTGALPASSSPLPPPPPPSVDHIPEILITPPFVPLHHQRETPATESLQRTYTEIELPLPQKQQRVSDKIVEPASTSTIPTMDASALIENVSDLIPREPSIRSISPNLNLSNDHRSRQNNIIKLVMEAEQDKLFELDELAASPLNKRNAARCFSDLLDLSKAGYLNLVTEKDSQELKFIHRGRKLLN